MEAGIGGHDRGMGSCLLIVSLFLLKEKVGLTGCEARGKRYSRFDAREGDVVV